MNPLAWLNPGRWLLLLAAVAALIAGYYAWSDHIGDEREAQVRAELQAAMQAQAERNRELQRAAETRYTVQAEVRDRFITITQKEVHHATDNLAGCVLRPDAVRLLNDAATCAREDRPAACGTGERVPGS